MSSDYQENYRGTNTATNLPAIDFSAVLVRTIESIRDDPAQLRYAIYELARIKLQRETWAKTPAVSNLEGQRLMLALETAIERVETLASEQDERGGPPPSRPLMFTEGEPPIVIDQSPPFTVGPRDLRSLPTIARVVLEWKWTWSGARPMLRGAIAGILILASFAIVSRQFDLFANKSPSKAAMLTVQKNSAGSTSTQAFPASAPQLAGLTLPKVYGVYAVNGGQIHELQPLAGRVPDPRVQMSTPVKTSSPVTVSDGHVSFIIYRRDIATNAPDRASLRVIAKVMRAMTFNTAGQPNTAVLDDQWTIRSNSYEFRVAPLNENTEMLLIRSENSDFVLPAGRYGLVVKGQAYDFTVAGPITDAAQCLERTEATNGVFYSECRTLR